MDGCKSTKSDANGHQGPQLHCREESVRKKNKSKGGEMQVRQKKKKINFRTNPKRSLKKGGHPPIAYLSLHCGPGGGKVGKFSRAESWELEGLSGKCHVVMGNRLKNSRDFGGTP